MQEALPTSKEVELLLQKVRFKHRLNKAFLKKGQGRYSLMEASENLMKSPSPRDFMNRMYNHLPNIG